MKTFQFVRFTEQYSSFGLGLFIANFDGKYKNKWFRIYRFDRNEIDNYHKHSFINI